MHSTPLILFCTIIMNDAIVITILCKMSNSIFSSKFDSIAYQKSIINIQVYYIYVYVYQV